jgi:glycosyltransferase involved in cell wall biosynthesis
MIVKNLISAGRIDTFDQAIKSVINQTYEPVEIVLLDGASTDGSFALLKQRYASCRGVALHCKSDRSVWEGMSNGIELAQGELIATMNSDDYFSTSEALEIMVQRMMDANADMVYSGATLLTEERGRRFPTHLLWSRASGYSY